MDPMESGPLRLQGRILAGRYLLEEEVASGGMGTVWKALDQVLGRPVAVKVLHERLAGDPDVLERFRLEAVAAARLSHSHVVRVFDTGIDDGVCFIVMELFESRTLEEVIGERGPLSAPEAVAVVRDVLEGLAHAHHQGVIHRDVKPGNVLLDRSGLVKVTDFGIAKAAFATSDLTTTGDLLGTAGYLAPEQVTGDGVDHRADIYACGVVLYEALTGRAPFQGATHIATATMRLTKEPPPPGAIRPGIPRRVEAVTMRALALNPDQRYQSAEEMRAALDRAVPRTGTGHAAPPRTESPSPPRSSAFRSWMAVPLVLVAVAALAVAGFILAAPLFEGGPGDQLGGSQTPGRSRPYRISAVTSFDPYGTGGEHDDDTLLAVDGSSATAWQTEGYDSPDLDKPGVGLVFDLGQDREVGLLRLQTETPGFLFRVYAGDDPAAFDPEVGQPVASAEGGDTFTADDPVQVRLEPVRTRYVLVWIIQLVEGAPYHAQVNEADFFAPGD